MKRRKRKKRTGITASNQSNESENKTTDIKKVLHSDLTELFHRLEGHELAEAVITRVRGYAIECVSSSIEGDLQDLEAAGWDLIQEAMRDELKHWVKYFILDEHRNFVVQCHARGLSTSEAAWELISEDISLNYLGRDEALGVDILRNMLIHRLSYLKPGTPRWPEIKYGALWRKARGEHQRSINDVPFTSTVEHVALLAKLVGTINKEIDDKEITAKDLHILTVSLMVALDGMHKFKAAEQLVPANFSAPQLVAVLERLTVALDTPEQLTLSENKDGLVSALEQLTHALKTSDQKALEDVKVVSVNGSDSNE